MVCNCSTSWTFLLLFLWNSREMLDRKFPKESQTRVQVNGSSSDWADVSSGIPQGTLLGPTLCLVYINDLPTQFLLNFLLMMLKFMQLLTHRKKQV